MEDTISSRFCCGVTPFSAPRFFGIKAAYLGTPVLLLRKLLLAVPRLQKAMAGRILIMFDGTRGDLQPLVVAARALIESGVGGEKRFFPLGAESAGIIGTDTLRMDLVDKF